MAEKVSTLVVVLNHHGCFKGIRKAICKLQETEDIQKISFDEAARTVTISGTFDPLVLPCKLRRRAGSLIRDIHLVATELGLITPQPPPTAMKPTPSAPSCGCWGYGGYGCGCGQASASFVSHPPVGVGYYYMDEPPLDQYPIARNTCDCSEETTCKIM